LLDRGYGLSNSLKKETTRNKKSRGHGGRKRKTILTEIVPTDDPKLKEQGKGVPTSSGSGKKDSHEERWGGTKPNPRDERQKPKGGEDVGLTGRKKAANSVENQRTRRIKHQKGSTAEDWGTEAKKEELTAGSGELNKKNPEKFGSAKLFRTKCQKKGGQAQWSRGARGTKKEKMTLTREEKGGGG